MRCQCQLSTHSVLLLRICTRCSQIHKIRLSLSTSCISHDLLFLPISTIESTSELTCCNSLAWLVHAWVDTSSHPSMFISHYYGHGIKLVRPLSTVDNTRDYARVSHSRQWSNYNFHLRSNFETVLAFTSLEWYDVIYDVGPPMCCLVPK